jgi:3-phenylpropionate/trans-cinnamate dioxygenase ferredoxin component
VSAPERIKVCPPDELKPGDFRHVQGRYELIVVMNVAGELRALSGRCMHDWSTPLGDYVDEGVVMCPRHGAQYCTKTGRRLIGPATSDLTVYRVEQDAEGVWVMDDQ